MFVLTMLLPGHELLSVGIQSEMGMIFILVKGKEHSNDGDEIIGVAIILLI